MKDNQTTECTENAEGIIKKESSLNLYALCELCGANDEVELEKDTSLLQGTLFLSEPSRGTGTQLNCGLDIGAMKGILKDTQAKRRIT